MAINSTIQSALSYFSPFSPKEWSSSSLYYEKEDGDERIFKIIREYLKTGSDMPVREAWDSILEVLPAEQGSGKPHIIGFSSQAKMIAEQIPYNCTSAHARLARLVCQMEKPALFNGRIHVPDTENFHVHMFESSLLEEPNAEDQQQRQYLSQHAFRAHLTREAVFTDVRYPVTALKFTFEQEHSWQSDDELESIEVIAAAIWIIVCGQEVYNRIVAAPMHLDPEGANADIEPGPRFEKGSIFGIRRWQFWARAFESAAKMANLSEEARRVSGKAAALMKAIELSMSW